MGEQTERDRTPLSGPRSIGKLPPWAWALMGALGIGGPSGALAYLRGEAVSDPRVVAAEAKVEELKAAEIQAIKTDVAELKKEQGRYGRLLSKVAAKLRVRDDETEE